MSIMPGQVIICNDCGQYGYRVTHVNPPILPVGWCEVPVNRKLVHTCAECTKKHAKATMDAIVLAEQRKPAQTRKHLFWHRTL